MAGMGVVVVLSAGGLAVYLGSQHTPPPVHKHQHAALSAKVVKAQTVGVIAFGPDDDRDPFQHDRDDHPLMLQPAGHAMSFVTISDAELADGKPMWTANQMADGSEIFIWVPNGKCLTAARHSAQIQLTRCDLSRSQRWHPVNAQTRLGQAIAAYANAMTGMCLTAPRPPGENKRATPGPAVQAKCGPVHDKKQEIAFWWGS